jgi:hypothetical protein
MSDKRMKYETPLAHDLSALSVRGGIDINCTGGLIAKSPPTGQCGGGASPDPGACSGGFFVGDPSVCTNGGSAANSCNNGSGAAASVCQTGSVV